jgi:hypothetical protein
MSDLPAGATERIAAARRAAEANLKSALAPLQKTQNPLECATVFAEELARPLFGREADELLASIDCAAALSAGSGATAKRFDAQLEALLARVVETIMPDASLDAQRTDETATGLAVVNDTGTLWERGADGVLRLATDPAYGHHGDWEEFAPRGVKFCVRRNPYPGTNTAVRNVLESALRAEKTYWMGRFYQRGAVHRNEDADAAHTPVPEVAAEPGAPIAPAAAPEEITPAPAALPEAVTRHPRRAVWLREQLSIREWDKHEWNKHDLRAHGGPDRASTQKILDGLPVREDVLEKVARALSAQGPKVTLRDIPRD